MRRIELPPLVEQRAMHNGTAGRRWLDELPGRVEALAVRWGLEVGAPFAGGTAGFVAPCKLPGVTGSTRPSCR